jgi:hypothetical protein
VPVAVPLLPPALALTVNDPVFRFGAVYRPVLVMLPLPVTVQVKVGCVSSASPNWS